MDRPTLRQLLGNAWPHVAGALIIGVLLWVPTATVFWWTGRTAPRGLLQHTDEFSFAVIPADLEALRAWVVRQPGIQEARLHRVAKDGEEELLELCYRSASTESLAPPWKQLGYPQPASAVHRWRGRLQIRVHQKPAFYLFLLARCLDLGALIVALRWLRRARRSGRPLPRLFRGAARPALLWGLGAGLVLAGVAWLPALAADGIAGSWALMALWPRWAWILGLCLLPLVSSLCQELFFRGALFGSFEEAGRPLTGVLVSALLFTLAQLNLQAVPVFLVIGIAQACLYRYTKSLLAPLLAGFVCAALAITVPSFMIGPGLLQDLLQSTLEAMKNLGK